MSTRRHARSAPFLAAALLLAAACGGGGGGGGFAVKGAVSGLQGSGLVLHLAAGSRAEDLSVPAAGAFAFATRLADGATYEVTVKTDPSGPSQACTVTGGSGTVAGADASVAVACATRSFTVGGTVSGLAAGTSVTLRNNGGDDLVVGADGPFAFLTPVASGAAYAVTVAQQPASPAQTCVVGSGSGTVGGGPVIGVTVSCEPNDKPVAGEVRVDGRVDRPLGSGLVLQVNGAFDTPVSAAGGFEVLTNLRSGAAYAVTVKTQPTSPWQACQVTAGGAGLMGATGAAGVVVSCTTRAFAVGGTAEGVLAPGLSLALTVGGLKGAAKAVGAGAFTLDEPVPSGVAWLVTVETQPDRQACTVAGGGGVMAGADVTDVVVTCACAEPWADCNGLPGDGCEVDLSGHPSHCGACGNVCALPNGLTSCNSGVCELVGCVGDWENCDGDGSDGCEVHLTTDPENCLGCGAVCSFPNAGAVCRAGPTEFGCGLGSCASGYGDCNGVPLDGCEVNLLSTPAHCGGCDQPCTVANGVPACAAGSCAVGSCSLGFANCNAQASDGCEVNLQTDPLNCGQCLRACQFDNAAASCAAGNCAMGACAAGYGDCNGQAFDGCEVNTNTSGANCGQCGVACDLPHAPAFCSGGACAVAACDAGWGDCNGVAADGCERPTVDDPDNCGGCGVVCASDRVCGGGTCQLAASCRDLLVQRPGSLSGVYTIDPGSGPVQVYCDMLTDGGGWTFFAHIGEDYTSDGTNPLFEADVGTYFADRTAPIDPATSAAATYSLGQTIYQRLIASGATELLVSAYGPDPGGVPAPVVAYYRLTSNTAAFTTGPLPCTATDFSLEYRTLLGSYFPGTFGACDDVAWSPFTGTAEVGVDELLIGLISGAGTSIGLAADPDAPGVPPGGAISGQRSWWYAR